ncbi:MAG TPA: glycosyltransferase [Alphaproteobacteria bacterium]|jgi:glycosyltransferase involved in cell wall biosynthesis|nr:glycosyltransferase [Alphaproteobacteria bacterium]
MGLTPVPGSDLHGPLIAPLPPDPARPLISVMIPTYNSGDFLRETLRSVIVQDLGPQIMEIALVDNCSTDADPFVIAREIAGDRIIFHRQPRNVGPIENFNTCARLAHGYWVHILHADDMIEPGFYAHARAAIAVHPGIGAYSCRHAFTDEDGTWLSLAEPQAAKPQILGPDFVERQLTGQRLHFASLIVKRSVYEELGGFRSVFQHCPDWDMWNRLVLTHRFFYDPAILACNRLHTRSDTSKMIRSGENVREERRCVRLSCSYLPREDGKRLYRTAMQIAAIRALRHVYRYWKRGDKGTAFRQLVEALRCVASRMSAGVAYGTWRSPAKPRHATVDSRSGAHRPA